MSGARNRDRKPRVTVKDLARDLGMSVSTVSRAFHPHAVIAPQTRDLVLQRAAEIGYRPNPFARSLITKRTSIVGLVVSDITNPFYPEVVTRLTEDLRAIDMNVMLVAASASGEIDDAVRLLLTYQPDLAVILASTLSTAARRECDEAGTPVIFFNRLSNDDDAFGVTCDNAAGGALVADYLIDRGHRRLAYVAARPDASTNIERREGFVRRAVERGLASPAVIEAGLFSYEAGYHAAPGFAALSPRPDGVFCANDILAIGFMDGVRRELGLSIPDDLSVVGFDDVAMAAWPSHGLTTVRQPVEAMLASTVELARKLAAHASTAPFVNRIPPAGLVERQSARTRHD
nr:LacI family DNA-binding transcriptional regulator [Prosthecomicrobium pneumaticum]